jgi:septal ring factor EnvC (AmiA/AmiB activator)
MKISELLNLTEDRQADLVYTEKRIKTLLDRVTVELSGNQSGVMSKLTTRYARLDKTAKLLAARREEVNAQMKDKAEALFDATDAVLTRVVETVSFTITLSKAEKAADKKPKSTVDYTAVVKELQTMVPELDEQLKALIAKYTEVVAAKDTPVALRVKSKIEEGVLSSVWSSLKSFAKGIKAWAKGYDERLDALRSMV